jgi:hypothetical protein
MFRLESILEQSPFESTFKIRKFKNKDKDEWTFIGNALISVKLLRQISSYQGLNSSAVVTKINFKSKKITVDGKQWNLLVDKKAIENRFSGIEEFVNFESKLNNLLKPLNINSSELSSILTGINNQEDPIGYINRYLLDSIDNIKSHAIVVIDKNGELSLENRNYIEDIIVNKILESDPNRRFSLFNVQLSNGTATIYYDGTYFGDTTYTQSNNRVIINDILTGNPEITFKDIEKQLNGMKNNPEYDSDIDRYWNVVYSRLKTPNKKITRTTSDIINELVDIYLSLNGNSPSNLLEELAVLYNQMQNISCRI